MPVKYGKGTAGKAVRLHSLYVRERTNYTCERCLAQKPDVQIQCAHIISRIFSATRTDENNAFSLCASCHIYFGKWPIEFADFTIKKIGRSAYNKLKKKALTKTAPNWNVEVERLTNLLDGLK